MSVLRTNSAPEESGSIDLFERLEQEASDDFYLLSKVGAQEFSTGSLLEMRMEAMSRLQEFDRQVHLLKMLALAAGGWVLAVVCAFFTGFFWINLACVLGLFLTTTVLGIGVYKLLSRYKNRRSLEHSLQWIEQELTSRNLIL